MKKPNRRIGVTLMELLLVVALLAIVAPVTYPVAMDAFSTTNDRPAVNMVKSGLAHAFSLGLIGRDAESKLVLEAGKPYYKKNNGQSQVDLPDGYTIGKIQFFDENGIEKLVSDEGSSNEINVGFSLLGKVIANGTEYAKVKVQVKNGADVIENIELNKMEVADVSMVTGETSDVSGSGSRCDRS